MATASELFLVRFRYWLVIGGMMTRSACGSTTSRSTCAAAAGRAPPPPPIWPQLHRLDAGAHDLGDEAGGIDRQPQQERHEFRTDGACRPGS